MSEQKPAKSVNIEIQIDEPTSMGQYINMVVAQHSATEFIFDFVFVPPGQPKARVRSRIIMTPEHSKRFLKVLMENISNFEKRFGTINVPEPPGGAAMPSSSTMQ